MRTISIVIPAFNEAATIGKLLQEIQNVPTEPAGFQKEIIVVDDGSTDETAASVSRVTGIRYIRQVNQGKGAAVQHGIRECRGDYVLVQDADLEYDPQDYPAMLAKIPAEKPTAVYGSRTLRQIQVHGWWRGLPGKHPNQSAGPWLANTLLSIWTLLLYGRWISDPLTGYKIYPTNVFRQWKVRTRGFETDHELTAKLIRAGIPIVEVPVAYRPRSIEEGKKIRPKDGLIALWTLFRFRFAD